MFRHYHNFHQKTGNFQIPVHIIYFLRVYILYFFKSVLSIWSFLFYSYFILRRKKDPKKRLEDEKRKLLEDYENVSGLESENDIRLRPNKVQDVKDDSWSLIWTRVMFLKLFSIHGLVATMSIIHIFVFFYSFTVIN